jgi:hypothetical protein
MKLLYISVSREIGIPGRVLSINLSLVEAEIFFDRLGNAKLMEKSAAGAQMLSSAMLTSSSTLDIGYGYWKATDEEIDILRRSGYQLADWRTLSVADIAKQCPDWALEGQEETV